VHANDLMEADRVASVISDEIVDLGWKSRHRTRPDHPVRLICVAVKPHESYRGMQGPHCDGVEIQASCAMIVCMLILIYTGEKPNRAMEQMVWYYLIGTGGSLLRRPGLNSARGCPSPRAGVDVKRRQDAEAQTSPSERRPGGPQRTSGEGAWAAPSRTTNGATSLPTRPALPPACAWGLVWQTSGTNRGASAQLSPPPVFMGGRP